ncbi:LPXTG cell wall anchor domain-containing protein [Peptoclostridium sp. AF21-18]|nr:LPXTG cell wall anchor domain-containing protein [Peptoclostridium sp. AF21-18]
MRTGAQSSYNLILFIILLLSILFLSAKVQLVCHF